METNTPKKKGGLQGEGPATLPRSTKFSDQPLTESSRAPRFPLLTNQPMITSATQRSTQTILDDIPQGAFNRNPENDDPDPDDSDVDDNDHVEELRNARNQKRAESPRRKRRYTIEPGATEDELLLTENDEGVDTIFATVQNAQDFVDSATAHPEAWCNAVRSMVTSMIAYQEQNQESNHEAIKSKERVASLTQQLKEAKNQLLNANQSEERLREGRTTYRNRNEKLKEESIKLSAEVQQLKLQLMAQGPGDPNSDPDDSDPDDAPRRSRHSNAPISRHQTPGGTTTSTVSKSNNRYPDVPDFYGNEKDRHTWESWRMHVESKFQQSWELFETELSKMLYIRDKCKDIAFNVIKARADMKNPEHYTESDQMLYDLEGMFGDYDKESTADAELHNPKFPMGVKDTKETFDAFHARFTAAIAPIAMSEREKVSHLRRLVTARLKYRILDYPISTSYRELVSRLRQVDMNMRLIDEQSPRNPSRGGGSGSSGARGGRGGNGGNTSTNTNSRGNQGGRTGYRHPPHVIERLKKEGRCFKCLEPGHVPKDDNAPCKDKPYLNEKQVTTKLAAVGVKEDIKKDSPPTYEEQLSEN